MSLFFEGLIFDEINFGFDKRISENDNVDKDAAYSEEDLECDLT